MASSDADDFKLTVLSPGGRDLAQYFDELAEPDSPAHPPVNFHGFAACTNGAFHRDVKVALAEKAPVLILLRGNFKASQQALMECKKIKRTVAISFKETGLHQIAQQLSDRKKLFRFLEIAAEADGCIATTQEATGIFRQARGKLDPITVAFIPTPYPLEEAKWNMAMQPNQQSGIFIGTREWDVPSRNHATAVLMARRLCEATNEPVTVFHFHGRKRAKRVAGIKFPDQKQRDRDHRVPMARDGTALFPLRSKTTGEFLHPAREPIVSKYKSSSFLTCVCRSNFCATASARPRASWERRCRSSVASNNACASAS